jgi:enoyl-CoA hydratase
MNTVLLDRRSGYALLTLNRPDKLNSLNIELLNDLSSVLNECKSDADIRVVVITGSGAKAFAAGADIAELNSQDATSGPLFAERGQSVLSQIERLGKPVIAAVNGFALGGGCELAMACHMRFAADTARFGQPEINLGIIPGYGGTQRLARIVGTSKALELILSGDIITASDAQSIGLVNRVIPAADLLATTEAFAANLASKAPLALSACLEATQAADDSTLTEGLSIEASIFGRTCGTADFKEGTKAFLEKRAPTFTGS